MRLIDADAAKATWFPELNASYSDDYAQGFQAGIAAIINDTPTIEAEPVRHGRWEKRGNKWQCTYCKVLMSIDGTPEENLLNYCSNCGTIMDGKENEHESKN